MTTYAEWHEQENDLTESEYEALGDYLDNQHEDTGTEYDSDVVSQFRDAYMGFYVSMAEFVEEQITTTEDIPHWARGHIDWVSMAMEWSHDYWDSENGHIFRAY